MKAHKASLILTFLYIGTFVFAGGINEGSVFSEKAKEKIIIINGKQASLSEYHELDKTSILSQITYRPTFFDIEQYQSLQNKIKINEVLIVQTNNAPNNPKLVRKLRKNYSYIIDLELIPKEIIPVIEFPIDAEIAFILKDKESIHLYGNEQNNRTIFIITKKFVNQWCNKPKVPKEFFLGPSGNYPLPSIRVNGIKISNNTLPLIDPKCISQFKILEKDELKQYGEEGEKPVIAVTLKDKQQSSKYN